MGPRRRWIPMAALVLLAASCSGKADGGGTGETPAVELTDFAFQPAVVDGEPGQSVRVTLRNTGSAEHTFTIEGQGVDVAVEPGGTGEAQVTLDGSPFICRYHGDRGMQGALAGGTGAEPSEPDTGGTMDDTGSGGGYDPYG